MLDLKRMRVLREVSLQGSFSAAADSLYVSQSAVSQQIAALEAEAGTPLLLRLRTGPVLTEAGELLVSHADAAICRLEQAERELAELSGLASGEVRIVSFPSASATIVTSAATSFRRNYPDVRLSLAEGEPEGSIPDLKRGRYDVAVVYDFELNPFSEDRDIQLTPLLTEDMQLLVAADHALAKSGTTAVRLEELAAGAVGGAAEPRVVGKLLQAHRLRVAPGERVIGGDEQLHVLGEQRRELDVPILGERVELEVVDDGHVVAAALEVGD